ncbi:protein of unknown function (plasmid) [Pararobbsia alpina]
MVTAGVCPGPHADADGELQVVLLLTGADATQFVRQPVGDEVFAPWTFPGRDPSRRARISSRSRVHRRRWAHRLRSTPRARCCRESRRIHVATKAQREGQRAPIAQWASFVSSELAAPRLDPKINNGYVSGHAVAPDRSGCPLERVRLCPLCRRMLCRPTTNCDGGNL